MNLRLVQFSDEDLRLLRAVVDRHRKSGVIGPVSDDNPMEQQIPTYVAKLPDGGIDALVGAEPGYADCAIYALQLINNVPTLIEITDLTKRVINLSDTAITGNYIPITLSKSGMWIALAVSGGGGTTYYKHMGRFQLAEELTMSKSQVWGELMEEWGEGTTHFGRDDGTGTATGSAGTLAILSNFINHAGTYEFHADAGDQVIAYYNKYQDGVEHWNIVIPECP